MHQTAANGFAAPVSHFVLWVMTFNFPAKAQRRKGSTLRLCACAEENSLLLVFGLGLCIAVLRFLPAAFLLFRRCVSRSFLRRFNRFDLARVIDEFDDCELGAIAF